MELRSLRYFQSVYELGSISAAARQCFVSQPSITSAILQLEGKLSTSLFIRHARGVLPTASADKLYPIAKEMAENAKTITHLFSEGPSPVTLRLGLMRSLGAQRMSQLLKRITDQIDHLELTLVEPEEPCDLRVVLSQSIASNESFIPIWQDQYLLALPSKWELAKKSAVSIQELGGMPFINRTPCDALTKLKDMMTNAEVHFQPRANIKTIEYAWQLVSAGIGAALLPNWQEIRQADGLVLKPINKVKLSKEIGLVYKTNKQNSPLIHKVKEICLQTLNQSTNITTELNG